MKPYWRRTGWQSNVGGTTISRNYTTNDLNQYTAIATTSGGTTTTFTYTYDGAGNLKTQTPTNNTGTKWSYNYDDANRLREVIRQDAATNANIGRSTFGYDGLSRKALAQEYIPNAGNNAVWDLSNDTRYVYDGREVIQERDQNSATKVKYVRGLDMGGGIGGLLSRTVVGTGGGTYFYHYDGAGNVCALTDANQNTVAEYRYDAFGNLIASSGSQAAQPYRFSTKEYHAASGFYDFGFRFYSPGMGRWVNRDPIGEAGGLNLYGMVGNSPTNAADADGRYAVPLVVAGIVGWFLLDAWQNPANAPERPNAPVYFWGEIPIPCDPYGQDAMTRSIPLTPSYYGPTWRARSAVERRSIQEHEAVHRRRAAFDMWIAPLGPYGESFRENPAYRYERWWNQRELLHCPPGDPKKAKYRRNLNDIDHFLPPEPSGGGAAW